MAEANKTILESEIVELTKFLNGLLHDIDKKSAQLQDAVSSPRSNNSNSQENIFTPCSSSTIKYTAMQDEGDADITNVVAFEEVIDDPEFTHVSINKNIVLPDVINDTDSELSLLGTLNSVSNLFSPVEPATGSLNPIPTTSTLSLDTISSVDTIVRPQLCSQTVTNIEPCFKYIGAPFYLFNVSHLDASTNGYKTLGTRSVVYYGDFDYSYSSTTHKARKFEENQYLMHILSYIQIVLPEYQFNSAMIHKYIDGSSHIPHHSDDEDNIVEESDIITISLGETRTMEFKNKFSKETIATELVHGEILSMSKKSQRTFSHAIHPEREKETRMSITLRLIKAPRSTNVQTVDAILTSPTPTPLPVAPQPNVSLPVVTQANDSTSTVTRFLNDLSSHQQAAHVPETNIRHERQTQAQRVRLPNHLEADGYQDFSSQPNPRIQGWRNAPPAGYTQQQYNTRQVYSPNSATHNTQLNQNNSEFTWYREGYQPNRNTIQPVNNTQFPSEQLHPSRHNFQHRNGPFIPFNRNCQEDVVFISSSMFADLDPSKLTTPEMKAHVHYYRGADSERMLEKLRYDANIQRLSREKKVRKVFLLTGTNNVDQVCNNRQALSSACSSIDNIIGYVQQLFPQATTSIISILPRALRNRQNVIDQINRHIMQACSREIAGRLTYIDTYDARLFTLPSGTRKSELFKYTYRNDTDNVHLNNYGIVKLGAYLKYLAHK